MAVLIANNAGSELASAITATQTTIDLVNASAFPTPTGGDWFPITLVETPLVVEIAHCTARSGNTLTVTRAQDGTAGLALAAGSRAELRMTRAAFASKLNSENYTATDVLAKIKTVDGTGSGMDADMVDGRHVGDQVGSLVTVGQHGLHESRSQLSDSFGFDFDISYPAGTSRMVRVSDAVNVPSELNGQSFVYVHVPAVRDSVGDGGVSQGPMVVYGGHGVEKRRIWTRFGVGSGTYQWVELFHTGNFDPATKLDASAYTAADVLAKLLTVDGADSGLDADKLDGMEASAFAQTNHNHDSRYVRQDTNGSIAGSLAVSGGVKTDKYINSTGRVLSYDFSVNFTSATGDNDSYLDQGEVVELFSFKPIGPSQNYYVEGTVKVQSGENVETLFIRAAVRSNTMPDLAVSGHCERFSERDYKAVTPEFWLNEVDGGGEARLVLLGTSDNIHDIECSFRVFQRADYGEALTVLANHTNDVLPTNFTRQAIPTRTELGNFGLKVDGSAVWHSGNFNPAEKRDVTNTSFTRYDLSSAPTTSTLDLATRQVFTVDATTTARTLSFANAPGAGKAMTVVVTINGSNAITWPAGINWHGGTAPELGATFTNVVLFWDGVQLTGVLGASQ